MKKIFVQIASYRDPECQWTVKDLFEKASHPERIYVGICWQFVAGEDDICFQEPYSRPNQMRIHGVSAKEGKGVCWARSLTQQLWQGEEFTLQIDSHMRFEPGWDEMLFSMWHDCNNKKAVLTCYPPGYTPPNDCDRRWIFGMGAKEFDEGGIFRAHGVPAFTPEEFPKTPIPGAFASANMLFGPSSIIHDIPYDPYLYFFGEEIMLAVRLWTNGYDIYHPNKLCIFHDWERGKRRTHFDDHRDWGAHNNRAYARVRHLLKMEISNNPEVLAEIEKYGLGTVRSLEEYQSNSGVNFAQRTISKQAQEGKFSVYGN